jgi:hypothetical protein
METFSLILIIVCIIISLTVIILLLSLGSIEPLKIGITLNMIRKTIGSKTYENGNYLIGPFETFIKYPINLITVEFSDSFNADVNYI